MYTLIPSLPNKQKRIKTKALCIYTYAHTHTSGHCPLL